MSEEITKNTIANLKSDQVPSAWPTLTLQDVEYWKRFPMEFWELVNKYYAISCAISRGVSDLAIVTDRISDTEAPTQVLLDIDRVAKEILIKSEKYVLAVDLDDKVNGNLETQTAEWFAACYELQTLAGQETVPNDIRVAVTSTCDQVLRGANGHEHTAEDFREAFCSYPETARANMMHAVRAMYHLLNCHDRA